MRASPRVPSVFASKGPRRKRAVGWVSTIACIAVLAGFIALGNGAAGARVSLSDLGAWLPSSKAHSLVHVNGATGQVDGRVELPGDGDGPLQVGVDGETVLVLDEQTGVVSRVDPAQLTVPQSRAYAPQGVSLEVGAGRAWIVDPGAGTVQPIDPATLAPLSPPIDLGTRPLGPSGVDTAGTLWVAMPTTGQVIAVNGTVPAAPFKVAEPGHPLLMTIADGHPVVTDAADGVVMPLAADGPARRINLPGAVAQATPTMIRVPERSEGPLMPVLAVDSGQLVLLNIADGAVQAAPLAAPKNDYGAPEVLGSRVYIPDRSTGEVLVYDTAAAAFAPSVRVTGTPGPLELGVRDGVLWANDQSQARAVVVDLDGKVHEVDKYEPGVPSAEPTGPAPSSAPPTGPSPTGPSTEPTRPGGGNSGGTGDEASSRPPTTAGPPDGTPPPAQPPVPVITVTERVVVTERPTAPVVPPATSPAPPPTSPTRVPEPPRTSAPPPAPTTPATKPPTTQRPPAPTKTTSAPASTSTRPTVVPSASVTPTASPTPTPTAPPTSAPPAPKPPGTPKAESGPGRITLVFAASPGARPDRYTIEDLPAGAVAEPGAVTPNGPFQFVVKGLACANEYSFKVTADFGHTKLASAASTAVRPCVLVSAPTAVKAEVPRNGHGFTATWKAPANTGGSTVQYKVAWADTNGGNAGSQTTSATTAEVTGLANGVTYNVTVTAVNEVGTGPAATTTASLVPPSRVYNVGPNAADGVTVGIRSGPAVSGTRSVAQIPAGYEGPITVHCQTTGQSVPRDGTSLRSSIWDKVTWNGHQGWTTDLYIRTPNSDRATFSPELWQCE